MNTFFRFVTIFLAAFTNLHAYDTLKISIADAERLFLDKNLLMLSQKYYVDENKANIITAKLYENPNFHFEIGAYNPAINQKFFNPTSQGQQLVLVNQLFYLAGKRNKRINLASINRDIAEYQFYDLLRTLRYSLRSSFVNLYYDVQALNFYNEEIPIIERTVKLYENQFNKGNLSLKEVVRLKSLLFSLQTEKLQYVKYIADGQQTLNVLLQTNENVFVMPLIDSSTINKLKLENIKIASLLDSAKLKRYDLKICQGQVDFAEMNYKYQKALGVPDPTIGFTYDRASNYIQNYIGPSLDIPMPFNNRNQGNIQAAKIKIKESELQYQYFGKNLEQEVVQSFVKASEINKLYTEFDENFTSDFDKLIESVIANFEKRNISMIEFIDLYESYKATMLQKYQLQNDRIGSLEDLNFRTGAMFFNW